MTKTTQTWLVDGAAVELVTKTGRILGRQSTVTMWTATIRIGGTTIVSSPLKAAAAFAALAGR